VVKFAISTQSKVCINEGDALPALLFYFVMIICQENQERLKVNGTHRVYDNFVSLLGEYVRTYIHAYILQTKRIMCIVYSIFYRQMHIKPLIPSFLVHRMQGKLQYKDNK